jgi:hypothetical protein
MDVQGIHRLAAAQGSRVFEGDSCLWVEKRKFFLESVPPHLPVHLEFREAARLFLRGAAAIRYTCSEKEGTPTFEYICDDRNYGLDSLAADARRRVRRGIDSCAVEQLDFDRLAQEGCAINRSVLSRQGRSVHSFLTDESMWKSYMAVCQSLPFVEAYGALAKGKLCAFTLTVLVDEYAYLLHTHSHSDYLKFSPMNALFFMVTKTMLGRPSVNCVSQGLESFALRPDLERFKLAMGYRKRELTRRVVVNPLARPIFSRSGAWLMEKLLKRIKPGLMEDFSVFARALRSRRAEPAASKA